MKPVDRSLDAFRAAVGHAGQGAPSVSKWTVGEHVHHCCLSMIGIVRLLEQSTPPPPPSRFSIPRSVVFLLGRIPRGRGRSPDSVVPKASVAQAELLGMIDESAQQLQRAMSFDRGTWFHHPVFGPLNRDEAIRFVGIHNRHHLGIVADILKTRR